MRFAFVDKVNPVTPVSESSQQSNIATGRHLLNVSGERYTFSYNIIWGGKQNVR